MIDPSHALKLQFLGWLADKPRTYAETMDAWRTSCPRLSIWEDCEIEGLVEVRGDAVHITDKGANLIRC